MKKEKIMNKEEMLNFFQEGIVNDLMFATRHYFIYRTVGENYLALKKYSNKNMDSLFGQLQSSSADLAVLSLAKIYDANNYYPVRSISGFLSNEMDSTQYYPFLSKDFSEFTILKDRFNIKSIPQNFELPKNLSKFFKEILSKEPFAKKIKNLKFVRNKYIAHNQNGVNFNYLNNFWEDFLDLIDFVKRFISLFGLTVFGTEFISFKVSDDEPIHFSITMELYWLVEEIEKAIGTDNFNYWWRNSSQQS